MYCSILHSSWGLYPPDAAQLASRDVPYLQLEQPKKVSIHWPISPAWGSGEGVQNLPSSSIENHGCNGYWGLQIRHITQKLFLFHMGDTLLISQAHQDLTVRFLKHMYSTWKKYKAPPLQIIHSRPPCKGLRTSTQNHNLICAFHRIFPSMLQNQLLAYRLQNSTLKRRKTSGLLWSVWLFLSSLVQKPVNKMFLKRLLMSSGFGLDSWR